MAFITDENVAKGWKLLWNADGTLPGLVPGGIWYPGPVPQAQSGDPYAILAITAQDANWTSGTSYWQTFLCDVRVWSKDGATVSGNIRAAMLACFHPDSKDDLSIVGATRVIELQPAPGSLSPDPRRKEAKDVLLTGCRWQLTLQGKK